MEKLKCKRCEYEWLPRLENPRQCPLCKSYSWEIDYSEKCDVCGKRQLAIMHHHIDGNINNNLEKNKIVVCSSCHGYIHNGLRKNRKGRKRGTSNTSKMLDYKIKNKLEDLRKKWLEGKKK